MGKKVNAALSPQQIIDIQDKIFSLVEPQLDEKFFLVDTVLEKELGYWYLRIYIEGQGFRISLNDCEAISRKIDPLIDDFFAQQKAFPEFSYNLEISSPGLFRTLKSQRELLFYRGQAIKAEKSLQKQTLEGTLENYDSEKQVLQIKTKSGDIQELGLNEAIVTLAPIIHFPEAVVTEELTTK